MRHTLILAVLVSVGPSVAAGQQTELKRALRNLVVAQEQYFVNHGTYTTDVGALGIYKPGQRDSIWVQVINAGGRSWNGRAIHMGARNKSCVIFVGYQSDLPSRPVTDADSIRAVNEGEPVCDR